jgi:hypothetical protein
VDEKRPGRRLLIAGAVAYGVVTLISLAFLTFRQANAGGVLWTLTFTPPLLGLLAVVMSPAALVYALISGVPGVSLVYGFKTAKRYWRVPLGGLLLASAVITAAYSFTYIR